MGVLGELMTVVLKAALAPRTVIVVPGSTPPTQRTTSGRIQIRPDARALWEIRGWRRQRNRLTGAYRTPQGSFVGEIVLERGTPAFYIFDPPLAVTEGKHAACFRARGGGRYFVHFSQRSREIDAGIVAIESLIYDSLAGRRRS